tara:strand:- start:2856 stop:3332 length:477 start_codon:yes stop_codon:yes gene_type:complete
MNSKIIKINDNKALIVSIDETDLTTEPTSDEDGQGYYSVYLDGYWLGYLHNKNRLLSYAQMWEGSLIDYRMSNDELDASKYMTRSDKKKLVGYMRDNYAEIVKHIEHSIKHNVHNGHHAGLWTGQNGSCNYDRMPVIDAIVAYMATGVNYPRKNTAIA